MLARRGPYLCAAMMVLNEEMTGPTRPWRPFSAMATKRFFDKTFIFSLSQAPATPSALMFFLTEKGKT